MIRRPPRPTRTYTSFPTRRSSDLVVGEEVCTQSLLVQRIRIKQASLDIQSHAARRVGDLLAAAVAERDRQEQRSEEHTSELQSLMRISYAVFCLKKKKNMKEHN